MRFVFLFLFSLAYACTDFVVQVQDGAQINGRSLEFGLELQSTLRVFPRNQQKVSRNPQGGKGVEWVSQYGYIGATALGMDDLSFDGLNEVGLSFGYLWLPGFTQYPTVNPEEMENGLDFVDFGAWVLGNFSDVAGVKEGLNGVKIWGHEVPPLGVPPVHAAIHDAKGNHLVVEFVAGEIKVYDNPISVLTNSPPFDWHMANLPHYLNLQAMNPSATTFRGMVLQEPGQGGGLLGIPGDWSSSSRFVRVATCLRFAKQPSSAEEGVNLAEHLLNTVDIPFGTIREKGKDASDYTQWIVIKDLTRKIFYFRSYKDLGLKKIELRRLDFEEGGKSLPLDLKMGSIDVTNRLN